jgi:2-phospho-L-lactate guanylyltransferase
MTYWAVIPIKTGLACKTRLQPVLSHGERLRLVRGMLGHVVAVASAAPGIDQVAILGNDRHHAPDAVPLIADRGTDLNSALRGALPELARRGATGLIVLPADLPRLTPEDVGRLTEVARSGSIGIAPDWLERGTNALAAPLGFPTLFRFGQDSFAAHRREARSLLGDPVIIRSPGLAFDLDEPEGLGGAAALFDPPIAAKRVVAG